MTAAIGRGDLDGALEAIIAAAYRRRGQARYSPAAQTASALAAPAKAFRVGSRVAFNSLVSPKYMAGLTGEVVKVNAATVKVVLDEGSHAAAGRFGASRGPRRPIGCPKSIVDVL